MKEDRSYLIMVHHLFSPAALPVLHWYDSTNMDMYLPVVSDL